MQHKTTLRVSDSRPNVNSFDRFKIFSSPPAQNSNEWTGTQSPFSFEKSAKNASQKSISWEPKIWVYGSLEGNSRNMSQINLWLLSNTKMHDSKDKTVAFNLKIEI